MFSSYIIVTLKIIQKKLEKKNKKKIQKSKEERKINWKKKRIFFFFNIFFFFKKTQNFWNIWNFQKNIFTIRKTQFDQSSSVHPNPEKKSEKIWKNLTKINFSVDKVNYIKNSKRVKMFNNIKKVKTVKKV